MKYQIYLNKETSELINYLAEHTETKPNTFIKQILEEVLQHSLKLTEKLVKEEGLNFNEIK